ncbi:MAG: hypothetical protein MZW92_46830 [Comamonadaceae bacterium]|nr:hypothetical protein [Comamonadaceae bacterium]
MPVSFGRAAWSNLARLYYALEAHRRSETAGRCWCSRRSTAGDVNLFTQKR